MGSEMCIRDSTTTPTSGETMLPGESHEWLDNDGEGLFTEPPKKGKKQTYGKLELKPPDIEFTESHSLVIKIPLPHPLVITPPVIWPSLFALESNRRPVITPLQYHTPSLSPPQLWGSCAWCLSPGVR